MKNIDPLAGEYFLWHQQIVKQELFVQDYPINFFVVQRKLATSPAFQINKLWVWNTLDKH